MEDLEIRIKNKRIMFSDYLKDIIELEIEDDFYDSTYILLNKENIIKIKNYLEEVLKIMASNGSACMRSCNGRAQPE